MQPLLATEGPVWRKYLAQLVPLLFVEGATGKWNGGGGQAPAEKLGVNLPPRLGKEPRPPVLRR